MTRESKLASHFPFVMKSLKKRVGCTVVLRNNAPVINQKWQVPSWISQTIDNSTCRLTPNILRHVPETCQLSLTWHGVISQLVNITKLLSRWSVRECFHVNNCIDMENLVSNRHLLCINKGNQRSDGELIFVVNNSHPLNKILSFLPPISSSPFSISSTLPPRHYTWVKISAVFSP